jgi:hypothetical protein
MTLEWIRVFVKRNILKKRGEVIKVDGNGR